MGVCGHVRCEDVKIWMSLRGGGGRLILEVGRRGCRSGRTGRRSSWLGKLSGGLGGELHNKISEIFLPGQEAASIENWTYSASWSTSI